MLCHKIITYTKVPLKWQLELLVIYLVLKGLLSQPPSERYSEAHRIFQHFLAEHCITVTAGAGPDPPGARCPACVNKHLATSAGSSNYRNEYTQAEDRRILSISWLCGKCCCSHLLSFMDKKTQANSALN